MNAIKHNTIPNNLKGMKIVELLDFQDSPLLNLEKSLNNINFISYLLSEVNKVEKRLYATISKQNILKVFKGQLDIKSVFEKAKDIYMIEYSSEYGTMLNSYSIPKTEFTNPVKENYFIHLKK